MSEFNYEHEKATRSLSAELAARMQLLYLIDFRTPQSAEYEATRALYLQTLADLKEQDKFYPPEFKDYRTLG